MTSNKKSSRSARKNRVVEETAISRLQDPFETMRRRLEQIFEQAFLLPWPLVMGGNFPSMPIGTLGVRMPICDMVDRGNRYELHVEVPGIDKDKINVKATRNAVEVSGEQLEQREEKTKKNNYVYSERSHRSFYRRISVPEEIIPSKVNAKVVNGVLSVELPKMVPTKPHKEQTRVQVK